MNKFNFTCRNLRRFPAAFIFCIASVSYIVNADAQLSWGVNGAGGNGTWDSATPNWSDGPNTVPWVNGGSAAFGGVPGIVSISGSVTASEVAFGVPGYVLQSGSLTSAPGGLTVRTDADATINATLANPFFTPNYFTKFGAAKLTATAGMLHTFSRVTIEAGELDYGGSYINTLAMGYWQNAVLTIGSSTGGLGVTALSGGGVVQPRPDGGAKTLYLNGTGDSFGGVLRDQTAAILSVVKTSTGLQRLTGANNYSGTTLLSAGTLALTEGGTAVNSAFTINGGTLLLDNSTISVADRLSDTAPMHLVAGSFVFQGNSLEPATETVGVLGYGKNVSVVVNPSPSQPAALTFAGLALRSASVTKGMVTFRGAMLGQPAGPGVASIFFQTPPPLVGGSDLHPEARIVAGAFGLGASGTTFVTYGANGLRPLADAEYARDLRSVSHWENADVSTAQSVAPDTTVNSLRLRGDASITGDRTFTLRSGIILTEPGEARIAVGTLDFGTREMLIVNEGNLTIAGRVFFAVDHSLGLTKLGAGRLVLAGSAELAGRIDVFQGVLRLQNATRLGGAASPVNVASGAAIELAGGVALTPNGLWTITGDGPDGRGGLRNVSGENRVGPLNLSNGSVIEVASGNLTVVGGLTASSSSKTAGLTKTGAGTLTLTDTLSAQSGIAVLGGTLALTLPGGTAPLGSAPVVLNGSTLRFAPALAKPGAILALPVPGTFTYKGGASTLALDRGENASVTVTFYSSFTRTSPATLLIAPAGGFATLSATEKIGSTSGLTFPLVNGIVSPSIVAQDTDANRSGDFLTYTAATGLKRATFSTSTNLTTAGSTAVFHATTPQTLTASATIYALKNNGQTIDLAGRGLIVGSVDATSSGIIFNGGSITGGNGTLTLRGNNAHSIYTSLAGGQISSVLTTSGTAFSGTLAKFGPGKLILSGKTEANVIVESGALQLDAPILTGDVNVVRGATLTGIGAITGAIRGGLISPGVGTGILRADRIGRLDTKLHGFDSSFDVSSFAFEFTHLDGPVFGAPAASGNDVLRLRSATRPFEFSLIATDEIALYFAASGGVRPGDTFRGGFFTDRTAAFLDEIDDAKFRYFVSDGEGGTIFNDRTYSERTDLPIEIDSVPQTANFGGGNVNGYIMQVRGVPEPSAMLLLLAASLALWSGSMNGRAAHGGKFPRARKGRTGTGM